MSVDEEADAIKRVQDAEARTKAMVEDANRDRAAAIEKAKQSAASSIDDAKKKLNAERSAMLAASAAEFAKAKERGLAESRKRAEKLGKTKATKAMIDRIKKEAIRKIIGG